MTFIYQCEETRTHNAHQWVKHWVKADLPLLRNPHLYGESWNALYTCRGITTSEVDPQLRVYHQHPWDATTRLCACGEFFEASLEGHRQHDVHRMQQVLASQTHWEYAVETQGVISHWGLTEEQAHTQVDTWNKRAQELRKLGQGLASYGGATLVRRVAPRAGSAWEPVK